MVRYEARPEPSTAVNCWPSRWSTETGHRLRTSARSWSAARAHTVTDHKQISTSRLKQKHTYVISRLSLDTCFRRLKKARETEVPIILISLRHRVETDGRVSICGARTMQCVPVCPLRTRCGGAATKKGSLLVQLPRRIATR